MSVRMRTRLQLLLRRRGAMAQSGGEKLPWNSDPQRGAIAGPSSCGVCACVCVRPCGSARIADGSQKSPCFSRDVFANRIPPPPPLFVQNYYPILSRFPQRASQARSHGHVAYAMSMAAVREGEGAASRGGGGGGVSECFRAQCPRHLPNKGERMSVVCMCACAHGVGLLTVQVHAAVYLVLRELLNGLAVRPAQWRARAGEAGE